VSPTSAGWKHVLFFFSTLLLLGLVAYSIGALMWLSTASCRDFFVATSLNAGFTFALAMLLCALALRQGPAILSPQTNPFESIGLLDPQEDGADPDEDEDADHDLDEFGLASPSNVAALRTRRELENEPANNL